MKAYVNYFDTDEAHATRPANDNSIQDEDFVIQFSASPDVTLSTEPAAQSLCAHLNELGVHATKWPGHTCRFKVEQLGESEYVIVCPDHPAF